MYIKLKADKDNNINSFYRDSNQGANPILEIFARTSLTGGAKQVSRSIIRFNLTAMTEAINTGKLSLTSSSVSANLKLYNVFSEDLPMSSVVFDVHRLTSDWDEGYGVDVSTTGFSNYLNRTSTNLWTASGGDFGTALTSITADLGDESWSFNIKPSLQHWLTAANYGLIVKLADSYESSTGSLSAQDYFVKRFYGRGTQTIFEPRIDIQTSDKFTDDTQFLFFGSTGSVYFYNKNQGRYADLNGTSAFPGYLSLSGRGVNTSLTTSASSVTSIFLSAISGSRTSTGIYKFEIPSITLTAASLSAWWLVWSFTGSLSAIVSQISKPITIFSPINNFSLESNNRFQASIINFRSEIASGEKVNYSVFFKRFSDSLSPLTAGSTAINSYIVRNGFWKVVDDRTGTDVTPWEDLSYNDTINYFSLDTNNLYPNRPYRVVLKVVESDKEFFFENPEYYYNFYLH